MHPDWLRPEWHRPGVGAVMTTRAGGLGRCPFDSLNLRHGIGDDPATVDANQAVFAEAIGATPVWLQQVHGTGVVRLTEESVAAAAGSPDGAGPADASVTTVPGIACTVQVADCLPVLFAAPGARAVGAAHAGWRGLAAGVLEAALAAVCEAGRCRPDEVSVWLGACIGPGRFEVGADVLRAFGAEPSPDSASSASSSPPPDPLRPIHPTHSGANPRFRPHAPGKWLADLPMLAADRLRAAGVRQLSGGSWCTATDASRFFSFRRDRVTGRMAATIWIEPRR